MRVKIFSGVTIDLLVVQCMMAKFVKSVRKYGILNQSQWQQTK